MALNKGTDNLQQNLAEGDRLLKEFGPAWDRVIKHLTQPQVVQLLPQVASVTSSQGLREHYEQRGNATARIDSYFSSIKQDVLIDIDLKEHQITLSFSTKQTGCSRKVFMSLCCESSGWLLRQKNPTEFTFGFAKVCDLRAIAWATAMEYREIGYCCRICCGGEEIDVDQIFAEAKTSALWTQLQEVPSCA